MQINRISYTNTYKRNQQNSYTTAQNQNFSGFKFRLPAQAKAEKLYIQDFLAETADFLWVDTERIKKYVTINEKPKMHFFHALATKARDEYFAKKAISPNSRLDEIENLYNLIKKPTRTHLSIAKNSNYSLDESAQILKLTEEKPENLELYKQIMALTKPNGFELNLPAKSIISILSSEHSAKLNEHFDNFSSYIVLNNKKENFLQELSAKLSAPVHRDTLTDKMFILEQSKAQSGFLQIIPDKDLMECNNELGMSLFYNHRGTAPYLRKGVKELSKEDLDFYKEVISTTNNTNFNARQIFFDNQCIGALDENGNSLEDIKRLFKRIDDDKYFRNIYESIAVEGRGIAKEPIDKLLYYIDSFGSKKVYKNIENFVKIANNEIYSNAKPEEIVETISKNLNNKYYRTSAMKNDAKHKQVIAGLEFFFPNTKVAILKIKDKMKYSVMPKIFGTGTPAPINKNVTYRKPAEKLLIEMTNAPVEKVTKPVIKRDFKAKKLQIQQETQEIIKSRMKSSKQIQEQSGDYSKKATKMRNQFLNEMFNSVAETRAQQRAQGIKRPTVSNFDVLEVYQKINGKNKNLFKYLLNSRTENGEREFDLKQIGKILDEIKKKRPAKTNLSEK